MGIASAYKLNNSVRIPALGFGTYKTQPGRETEDAVSFALKTGYRLIDTATYYRNEKDVGKAVRDCSIPRKEIFVTTKIWNSDHGDPIGAFEKSLSLLKIDYIDLYLIHWPVEKIRNRTWKTLTGLLDGNKCRSIGVSNFTIRHLEELLAQTSVVPAVNQVEFSPFLFQKDLLDYCTRHKIQLEAYAPLTRGDKFEHPVVHAIAQKYSKTSAQVLLRWCVQHKVIPLPKSKTPQRIRENANIFDFSISAADMKKLDSLNENYRVTWNPEEIR
jgi:diketogulonate reductase-like aldo/keto reductase